MVFFTSSEIGGVSARPFPSHSSFVLRIRAGAPRTGPRFPLLNHTGPSPYFFPQSSHTEAGFSERTMRLMIAAATLLVIFVCVPLPAVYSALDQPQPLPSGAEQPKAATPETQKPVLKQALMSERVENLTPVRPGFAFSVSSGQVCCFTSFDPVPQATVIYHRWFRRDELSTQTRLRLYPPKWSTYSVIQLRETDKGPWRVEVIDQNGQIFQVLRFSITD